MALFTKKKDETDKEKKAEKKLVVVDAPKKKLMEETKKEDSKAGAALLFRGRSIKQPRVTEKASVLAEENKYVFNVENWANKQDIKREISEIYNVIPVRVNMVNIPAKVVVVRGIKGKTSKGKKAIIYLKKGDKIEII